MYDQQFIDPRAYIDSSSNPEVMRAVVNYVIDGVSLPEAHRLFLHEDATLWRKSLKVCLADEGYKDPRAQQRFAELARDLKCIDGGKKPVELPNARRFSIEQATIFRKYIAQKGLCYDLKSAFSVGEPKIAESQRKLCQRCVARVACAEYALIFNEEHGMWGGMSERARRRVRKRIKSDFKVKIIESELAYAPVDSEIRVQIRERIPEYIAIADEEVYRGPGYPKKFDKQIVSS